MTAPLPPRALRAFAITFEGSPTERLNYWPASNHDRYSTEDMERDTEALGWVSVNPDGTRTLTDAGRQVVVSWHEKHEPWHMPKWAGAGGADQ